MNMEVLKLRMEQLRLRETETTPLRVLVLDASLPKQRLGLNFGTQGDAKRSLNCGTSMGEGDIPLGTKFAMLGMSPTNKKSLTMRSRSRSDAVRSERRRVHVRRAHRNEAIQN